MKCPLCENKNNFIYVESKTYLEKKLNYEIYRCLNCLSEFCEPMEFASRDWYEGKDEYYGWRWEFSEFIKDLKKAVSGGKVLEIGCGEGIVIQKLKDSYDVYGIDINSIAVEKAKSKGLNVYTMTIEEFLNKFPSINFDVIAFFHVLEHLENPLNFLRNVHKALNPNGLIFLSVPNPNRISLILSREDWDYPPHHLIRFSILGLQKILEKAGFKMLKIKEQPKDLPFIYIKSTVELDKFIKKFFGIDVINFGKIIRNTIRLIFFIPFNIINFLKVLKTSLKYRNKKGTSLYVVARKN